MKRISKKAQITAKKEANFDPSPPACKNCVNYFATHKTNLGTCAKFKFAINKGGLCDHWQDKNTGEVLDIPIPQPNKEHETEEMK